MNTSNILNWLKKDSVKQVIAILLVIINIIICFYTLMFVCFIVFFSSTKSMLTTAMLIAMFCTLLILNIFVFKNFWRRTKRLFLILLLIFFCYFGLVVLSFSPIKLAPPIDPCSNDIVKTIDSAEGRWTVIAYISNCGATTDFAPVVALVEKGTQLKDSTKSDIIFSGYHSNFIDLAFEDDNNLVITHDLSENDISLKTWKAGGIYIKYIKVNASTAKPETSPATPSLSRTINNIKKWATDINNDLTNYEKNAFDLWGESTDGGEITYYRNGDEYKKIEVKIFGETFKSVIEYYFYDSKLIFAFHQRSEYNRPYYWDAKTSKENGDSKVFDINKSKILEDRYYFRGTKLIKWIKGNEEMPILSPEFRSAETSVQKDLEHYLDLIKHNQTTNP